MSHLRLLSTNGLFYNDEDNVHLKLVRLGTNGIFTSFVSLILARAQVDISLENESAVQISLENESEVEVALERI